MINDAVGVRSGSVIDVAYGKLGHAIFGPYHAAEAGEYIAEFWLEPLDAAEPPTLCALVDVVCDIGRTVIARAPVFTSQLQTAHRYEMKFALGRRVEDLELRVYVNGTARIRITDACTFRPAQDSQFVPTAPPPATFLNENTGEVENLFINGFKITAAGADLIVRHSDVSLYARRYDDVRFLGEIFLSRVYDLAPFGPSVLIDVGMNIGLTSLLLAQQPKFEEVYGFEPFPQTYQRALQNLALNPAVAGKIRTFNFGLSDRDETLTGYFNSLDSGQSSTTVAGAGEEAASVTVRDAAATLEPIFAHAKRSGRRVIMKIDCEGAEFALFRSLIRKGLLDRVTAMMVEWHRGYGDKGTLLEPLAQRNFIVIDQDSPAGNGFFYAVRAA